MKKYIAVLIILLSLAGILKGVNPTVGFSDSGELITGAYTLGVSHSPGQPLYLMFTHLGALLPLGEIAFRINLISSIFACISLLFLYLCLQNDTPTILSLGAVTTVFFFEPFLNQSIWSEVYTLFISFILGSMYLIKTSPDFKRTSRFLGLLLGLGVIVHYMTLLLLPVLVVFLFIIHNERPRFKTILLGAIMFLLPMMIFLYLPLRAANHPYLNWGSPFNMTGFLYHLTIKQRGGGLPGGSLLIQLKQLITLGSIIIDQFNWTSLLVPLIFLYAFLAPRKERSWSAFLLTMTLVSFLLFGWFLKFNTPELAKLQGPKFFLIPVILIVYIFFKLADRLTSNLNYSTIYQGVAALTLLFLIHPNLISNISNFRKNSSNYYAYDYSGNMLNISQKDDAIYLADDSFGFPAMYQLVVLNKTPGRKLVHLGNTFTNWGVENLFHNYPELRPSYLKTQKPPFSEYNLGPKLIRELIREKAPDFSVFSPFSATDKPTGFKNYKRILGCQISVTPPTKNKSTILKLRGFRQNSFIADQWSKSLITVYRSAQSG